MLKRFESRSGQIGLLIVTALIGGVLAGPVTNFTNSAQVAIEIISIDRSEPMELVLEDERAEFSDPVPSFVVTLDAINHGNGVTRIGTIGSLQIQSPNADAIVILTLLSDLDKVAVLEPGQRQRVVLSTKLPPIRAEMSETSQRAKMIRRTQLTRINKVLKPLWSSGVVHDCRITLPYAESKNAQADAEFGESQAVYQLERVLNGLK